jgi:prepilin-type N-terminal cleavage/methylation domain-containing protein
MRSSCRHRTRAFTLVELLVVIGIIAALIGILLPVLSGVSARGRDIKCQSNIRQIVTSLITYAQENKGSYPYGFIHSNADPNNNWNGSGAFFCWASQVGKYTVKGASGMNDLVSFPPLLQCPELATAFPHFIGYIANMVVMVSPRDEFRMSGPPYPQTKPSMTTLMLKEGTALIWDTAIEPGWYQDRIVGYLISADIDGQRIWRGARYPQFRYFSPSDVFGRIPPGVFSQNKPVDLTVQGGPIYVNTEAPDGASYPFQGNLRFRHNKDTTCNVGFSDGSVRQFRAKLQRDGKRVQSHDALRKYFMTKWPTSTPPDRNTPHD